MAKLKKISKKEDDKKPLGVLSNRRRGFKSGRPHY